LIFHSIFLLLISDHFCCLLGLFRLFSAGPQKPGDVAAVSKEKWKMIRFSQALSGALALSLVMSVSHARADQNSGEVLDRASTAVVESNDRAGAWPNMISGVATDPKGKGLRQVGIVIDGKEYVTTDAGEFNVPGNTRSDLLVKKPGFRKMLFKPRASGELKVTLEPLSINGVYVQTGIFKNKNSATMQNIMNLMKTTELNAMVVDMKDDDGRVSQGLKPYIDEMHAKGLYMIARVTSFKDNIAPRKHPEMAIIDKTTGKPWQDRKGITYLDPFKPQSHAYLLSIAKQAVEMGFDEIEYDYVRFPTDGNRNNALWPQEFTPDTRTRAITSFLKESRQVLGAMGAFVAADVFGDTAYVRTDSGIGQRIEDITPYLDYVCPMVYPSGFAKGTAGVGIPVDHPKEIIEDSVKRYRLRADEDTVIRPWLQSFRDYAYNHREYGAYEIRAQIDGSDHVGGDGFLLWNAASRYSDAGLKKKILRALHLDHFMERNADRNEEGSVLR
jgi:hypothetical protein